MIRDLYIRITFNINTSGGTLPDNDDRCFTYLSMTQAHNMKQLRPNATRVVEKKSLCHKLSLHGKEFI